MEVNIRNYGTVKIFEYRKQSATESLSDLEELNHKINQLQQEEKTKVSLSEMLGIKKETTPEETDSISKKKRGRPRRKKKNGRKKGKEKPAHKKS